MTQSSPGPLQSRERKGISCLSFHFTRINCVVDTHNTTTFAGASSRLCPSYFLTEAFFFYPTHTHRGPSSWPLVTKPVFSVFCCSRHSFTSQPLANSLLWPPVNHLCCSNDVLLPTMTLSSLRKFLTRTGPHQGRGWVGPCRTVLTFFSAPLSRSIPTGRAGTNFLHQADCAKTPLPINRNSSGLCLQPGSSWPNLFETFWCLSFFISLS